MAFNDRLKEARLSSGLTQEQLAKEIGVAKSTLTGYEKGNREPSIPTVQKMMSILSVDANYLYQDEMTITDERIISLQEREHIKKYRSLEDYDKQTVDLLMDRLVSEPQHFINIDPPKVIECYPHLASAGTGQYVFDDIPAEKIEVEWNSEADFAIGVQGDSMEPTYHDEDTLLVKRQNSIEIGDIGIFIVNGESFVKEYRKDRLVSHNDKYEDIKFSEHMNIVCVGKVIGVA